MRCCACGNHFDSATCGETNVLDRFPYIICVKCATILENWAERLSISGRIISVDQQVVIPNKIELPK